MRRLYFVTIGDAFQTVWGCHLLGENAAEVRDIAREKYAVDEETAKREGLRACPPLAGLTIHARPSKSHISNAMNA